MKRRYLKKFLPLILTIISYVIYNLYTGTPFPQSSFEFNPSPSPVAPKINADSGSFSTSVVKRVVDGDTIELEDGRLLRYIGIDTPETKHPTKKVECFGKEAYEKNKELIEGKRVQLEKDVSEVDRYGRLLRYVYIMPDDASRSATLFINQYLIQEGYATAVTFPPDVKYAAQFKEIEREAQSQNKGLWNTCEL